MLINNNNMIYYLMMSSFLDIWVSILCSNDARRDIKHVEGESDNMLFELPMVVGSW